MPYKLWKVRHKKCTKTCSWSSTNIIKSLRHQRVSPLLMEIMTIVFPWFQEFTHQIYVLINTLLHKNNEIEQIIKELLDARVICPNTSPYSSPIVMVLNMEGTSCMCHDFRSLNKLMIKAKFPIPVIDDLLDELRGANFFINLDLRSGYQWKRHTSLWYPSRHMKVMIII